MNENMLFSVIIPTYNRRDDLCSCLECLAPYFEPRAQEQLGFKVEVIVSDDGQEIDLCTLLSKRFPWITYLRGPACGPASNRNNGAKHAKGEWLVFTDDDCLPQPGWLEGYHQNIRLRPDVTVFDGIVYSSILPTLRHGAPCNPGGYLWSCNMAIKSSLFLSIGGFCELFPYPAMEDVELRTRLQNSSITICISRDSRVYHPPRMINNFYTYYYRSHKSALLYWSLHPNHKPSLLTRLYAQMRWSANRLVGSTSVKEYKFMDSVHLIGAAAYSAVLNISSALRNS